MWDRVVAKIEEVVHFVRIAEDEVVVQGLGYELGLVN